MVLVVHTSRYTFISYGNLTTGTWIEFYLWQNPNYRISTYRESTVSIRHISNYQINGNVEDSYSFNRCKKSTKLVKKKILRIRMIFLIPALMLYSVLLLPWKYFIISDNSNVWKSLYFVSYLEFSGTYIHWYKNLAHFHKWGTNFYNYVVKICEWYSLGKYAACIVCLFSTI